MSDRPGIISGYYPKTAIPSQTEKQEKKNLEQAKIKKNSLLEQLGSEKEKEKLTLIQKQKNLKDIENIITKLYADKKTQREREKQ